jgi:methenyltetrahydromethanopterin cyclohydrolase
MSSEHAPEEVLALNLRALALADRLCEQASERRVMIGGTAQGARMVDCGSKTEGGLLAGLDLARICLSGLAEVNLVPLRFEGLSTPGIQVVTDHPVVACLASQYAGWAIQVEKFFAMGSGPMRAAATKEALFERIGHRERPERVVGVLECRKPPTEAVVATIAEGCGVEPSGVTLLFAPTASLAGTAQIVARSVETGLHKLAELGFDLSRIVSAHGTAPLPPVARDDLAAIGRTNDAILYGADVTLIVRGDDESLEAIGPGVPSCSSRDHGAPFSEIFARYGNDFYAVDPHLFSPAIVTFQNLETGKSHRFGRFEPAVLARSFGIS